MATAISEILTGRVQQQPTREPLYDTVGMVAATAYQQLAFFQVPEGGIMGAAPFNLAKTKSHTNMQQAGQSGRGRDTIIQGINLKIFGDATGLPDAITAGSAVTVGDLMGILSLSHLEFGIGLTELEIPLDTIPSGNMLQGLQLLTESFVNGLGTGAEFYTLRIPFTKLGGKLGGFKFYQGETNLQARLVFDPAFTPTGNPILRMELVGVTMRPL